MAGAIGRTLDVHLLLLLLLPILILQIQFKHGTSQQAYLNNKQFDCYVNYSNTLGYVCNGPSSCTAYLTFRSSATYSSVPSIAYLFSANADAIAEANNVSDVASFREDQLLYVPVNCSCVTVADRKRYYQHNASYRLKTELETYLSVANDTYEGLTTCQAMMSQNKYDSLNLLVGEDLIAPLIGACPSTNQTKKGFNYVVSYLAGWNDDVSTIAALFGVDEQRILEANELDSSSTIYPFNPILVPLETTPTKINLNPSPPSSTSPPSPPPPPSSSSSGGSSKKWVFVGIGIGSAVVALPILFLFIFLLWRRKRKQQPAAASPPKKVLSPVAVTGGEDSAGYRSLPGGRKDDTSNSWSISSDGVRYAIESLTVYKVDQLQKATGNFSESNRIKGSVFRGKFNGDDAAVKVLNGDVSAEINILKQINHSNIIRLSGFCVHDGSTYLVYEFADKGSLRDLLVESKHPYSPSLGWKQRVQIAYGIAEALNYLHNFCNPPYVHKDLSSSNVLLDDNLRTKITNFGLARTVADDDEMHMTKHVVGTKGYLAPEYIADGLVTPKMDVYAFGMVILELMSGRIAASKAPEKEDEEELLTAASITEVLEGGNVREKLSRFMDGGLRNGYPFDLAYSMAELAKMCLACDLNSRLSISEVLVLLSKIHSSSLDWDPSDELDRSSSLTQGR